MRVAGDTKERIEVAALELFVYRGIDGTSIGDIARKAGVSQGALYNHYPSKEQLAYQLFARGWTEMGAELRRLAAEHSGLEAKFRSMVGYVFERFDRDWALVSYTFFSRHHHLRRVPRGTANPYLVFRAVIHEAISRREIPAIELDIAASMVIGALIQVIDTKILGWIDGPLAPRAAASARVCVNMLKG